MITLVYLDAHDLLFIYVVLKSAYKPVSTLTFDVQRLCRVGESFQLCLVEEVLNMQKTAWRSFEREGVLNCSQFWEDFCVITCTLFEAFTSIWD